MPAFQTQEGLFLEQAEAATLGALASLWPAFLEPAMLEVARRRAVEVAVVVQTSPAWPSLVVLEVQTAGLQPCSVASKVQVAARTRELYFLEVPESEVVTLVDLASWTT